MSEVAVETAISLRNRRDPHYADGNSCRMLVTRSSIQRPPCWDPSDNVDMIDTVLRGWTCPPIYMIERPELTDRCADGEDHVFDGAHKLEAVFDYIDDKFPLKATLLSGPLVRENDGRRFSDLSRGLQDQIKKYRFYINRVDAETAEDPDQLCVLWQRVNKAGKQLNKFELNIPRTAELIEAVLKPAGESFRESLMFPKEVSKRGELEQRLQVILALSDLDDPRMQSQKDVVQKWLDEKLGADSAARAVNVQKHGAAWRDVLVRAYKMMEDLRQLGLFHNQETEELTITNTQRSTELVFLLGRLARRFPRIEDFRSQKIAAAARFRAELFGLTGSELAAALKHEGGRNGFFQQKLVRYIDRIVCDLAGCVQPRLFTKKQKEEKLKEQGGRCVACNERILRHQLSDGDHVVEWSAGGATTLENLQVLHRHCHQLKTAAASS